MTQNICKAKLYASTGNDCIDKFINGQMVRIADRQDLGVAEIQYQEQATNDLYVKLQNNDWDIYVSWSIFSVFDCISMAFIELWTFYHEYSFHFIWRLL